MAPSSQGFGASLLVIFVEHRTQFVIPALVAGIHLSAIENAQLWIAGINPAMTMLVGLNDIRRHFHIAFDGV